MAAVAGILVQELLGKGKWYEAGAQEYWMPNGPLLAIEAVIMGFLELKRYQVGCPERALSLPLSPTRRLFVAGAASDVTNPGALITTNRRPQH